MSHVLTSWAAFAIRVLLSAAGAGMIVAWAWMVYAAGAGRPLAPARLVDRSPVPPWGSLTVLGALLAYLLVSLSLADLYRLAAAQPRAHAATPRAAESKAGEPAENTLSEGEQTVLVAIADLILLLTLPIAARWTSGARARDFGASLVNWRSQAAVGFTAAFLTIPAIYVIQCLAVTVWTSNEHKLATLLRDQFSLGSAALALVTAVVLAPAFEELFFRALVQRWLVALFHQCSLSLAAPSADEPVGEPAIAAPLVPPAPEGDSTGPGSPLDWPATTWLGIAATSLFFGSVHAAQWPAPIPLFVFALAIGVVYELTGSLMAAVIMHATLNAISTLAMILYSAQAAEKSPDPPRGVNAAYNAVERPEVRSL